MKNEFRLCGLRERSLLQISIDPTLYLKRKPQCERPRCDDSCPRKNIVSIPRASQVNRDPAFYHKGTQDRNVMKKDGGAAPGKDAKTPSQMKWISS